MANVFGATSTTDEVLAGVKLHGKRILVTGVSAGIGVELLFVPVPAPITCDGKLNSLSSWP